ncbi:MAG: 3'-5' exonuclease [Acidimicrobiales bacterium]
MLQAAPGPPDPYPPDRHGPTEPCGHPKLYGLDIETDTSMGGLDPRRASVLAVAVVWEGGEAVMTGAERRLLAELDSLLSRLDTGVIVTWNGSGFDLPFLQVRAALNGVRLGLRLAPGTHSTQGTQASWHAHDHLDAYLAYKTAHLLPGASYGLKAVAKRAGLHPVEVDASRVHLLDRRSLRRYVASDARMAAQLAAISWPLIAPPPAPTGPGQRPAGAPPLPAGSTPLPAGSPPAAS